MATQYNFSDPNFDWNAFIKSQGSEARGNNVTGDYFRNNASALQPETLQEIQWLTNYLGPQYRSQIESFVSQMNDPQSLAADRAAYANQSYEQAGNSGGLLAAQLRGQGYGSGAQQGATTSAYQGAQRSSNNFNAQQMSPQARLQRVQASLQALQSGFQMPAAQAQQSYFAPLEQRHTQNQSEVGSGSAFGPLLQLAGAYLGAQGGGGMGSFFGHQSGGSSGGYSPQNTNISHTSGNVYDQYYG